MDSLSICESCENRQQHELLRRSKKFSIDVVDEYSICGHILSVNLIFLISSYHFHSWKSCTQQKPFTVRKKRFKSSHSRCTTALRTDLHNRLWCTSTFLSFFSMRRIFLPFSALFKLLRYHMKKKGQASWGSKNDKRNLSQYRVNVAKRASLDED